MSALAVALALSASPVLAKTVVTDAGAVRTVSADGILVFKGIPFAAPPIGALRWREPRPPAAWTGVRPADRFAPACIQTGVSMPGETPPAVAEDCLYLNVWTPGHTAVAPRAVLVWIYGGGFSNGSASMPLYWGDRLARKGLVVVTIAYRVGPLGFLAHPELTAESPHHSSGNYGFQDQIAALRWVQRNIAAFGGDPAKVTVAGQSAGAASVSVLAASPLAKGLFRSAIAESGGLFEPLQLAPGYQLANAERDGQAYAASLGAHALADLRGLPAAALLKGKADSVTHPLIEPYVLPASPYAVFARGEQNPGPLLVGSNADEAKSLITDLNTVSAANFEAGIAKRWGQMPPALLAAYPHAIDPQARKARLDFERDLRFGWDDWAWARLAAAKPQDAVYYYHFAHIPPFPPGSPYDGWGPSHFSELWYVFDHLDQEPTWRWTAADRSVAALMSSYWANFVKTGDPNGRGLPAWPRFDPADARVLQVGETASVGGVSDLASLKVFEAVYDGARAAPFGAAPPGP